MQVVMELVQVQTHSDDPSVPEGEARAYFQRNNGGFSCPVHADELESLMAEWVPYKNAVDAADASGAAWPSGPLYTVTLTPEQ